METDLLYVEGLSLSRGNFRLDNISFSVAKEEILSVIGRTGAGKSLLLETLAGFQRPACGTVMYCGTPVHQIPAERRNIGYLHQDYSLFSHMTVEQNIGYSLKLRRVPGRQRRFRVEELAERMGISHLLRQYPGTLSGGEQQRTAFARAPMMRPQLLLLDEPFAALDPVTKESLYALLQQLRAEFHCSVLFVTHDFHEAQRLSDRVGALMEGRLQGIVPAEALLTASWPPEVREFLGLTEGVHL